MSIIFKATLNMDQCEPALCCRAWNYLFVSLYNSRRKNFTCYFIHWRRTWSV